MSLLIFGEIKRRHILRLSELDVQIAAGEFCLQLIKPLLGDNPPGGEFPGSF